MKRAIAWFANNTVAANLMMVVILAGGAFTISQVKLEIFPEVALDMVTVSVEYLGAAPEEVEESVNVRIEEAIQGLDGIKKITSLANEGFGVVTVEMELDADTRKVLDDIKSRVDGIDTFPAETEKPIYVELTNRAQVVNVAVYGPTDEKTLRSVADRVRDELAALPEITVVEMANARPYEVSIEISESALRRWELNFDDVARAVRRSSLDLPAGSVKTAGGEILLRTQGQAYLQDDFEQLVLLTRTDGTQLRLRDVATVRDDFADTDQFSFFDGEPALILEIYRTGDQDSLEIADAVTGYVSEAQAHLPEGLKLSTWADASVMLKGRLGLLLRNGAQGFGLVVLILALFLRFRLSMWVSLGLPISFLGAIWLIPTFDISINLLSLFAFIIVLGIVVDDAIIVGENIHTTQHRMGRGLEGAIEGAHEVSTPVVFAVLTTIAAFMPMLSIEGVMGKFMRVIPLIVIPTLVFSLVESLFILPAHLSHYKHVKHEPRWWLSRGWQRFQGAFARGLEFCIERVYRPTLAFALNWRYATLTLGLATLMVVGTLAGAGYIRFNFFPAVDADFVSAAVTMPQGTPVEITAAAVDRLEQAAAELQQDVDHGNGVGQDGLFRHLLSAVGAHPYREQQSANAGGTRQSNSGSHLGEVTVELAPSEVRNIGSEELGQRWREKVGQIPDALELEITSSLFVTGEDVNVQLTGPDIAELRSVADELKLRLVEFAGVYDVSDSFREGKQEIKLQIKPQAEIHGLRLADVALQVRQAFYGEEAQRIQRGRDDIRVMVRYPEDERRSVGDLENMRIRTPEGLEVPFSEVAEIERGRGFAQIKRVDRRRAVNVTAGVDVTRGNATEINGALAGTVLPELLAGHPAVRYTFEGQSAQMNESVGGLLRGFAVAALVIFALLAVPLRSYVQPLLIMSAIPFGLVGAVLGHLIMGMDLSIMSLFGVVALAGVVVNDSLVMVTFVNRAREQGESIAAAARQAGARRFRPILLTSLTTFGGLTPLLLERSMQARFLIPMAISLAFGVMFSTFITLVLLPCGYLILEDLRELGARLRGKKSRIDDPPHKLETA